MSAPAAEALAEFGGLAFDAINKLQKEARTLGQRNADQQLIIEGLIGELSLARMRIEELEARDMLIQGWNGEPFDYELDESGWSHGGSE